MRYEKGDIVRVKKEYVEHVLFLPEDVSLYLISRAIKIEFFNNYTYLYTLRELGGERELNVTYEMSFFEKDYGEVSEEDML